MSEIKVLIVDDHFTTIMGLEVLINSIPNLKLVGSATDGEEGLSMIEQLHPDVVLLDIYMRPPLDGIRVTEIVTKKFPNTKVILHTSSDNKDDIIKGYEAGAMGYIPKTFKPALLIEAINKVYNGEAYIIGDVAKAIWDYFRKNEGGRSESSKESDGKKTSYETLIDEANKFCISGEWQKAIDKFASSIDVIHSAPNAKDKKSILTNLINLTPTELKVLCFALKESSKSKDIAEKLDMAVKTVSTHRQNIMNKFVINDFDEIVKELLKNNIIEG